MKQNKLSKTYGFDSDGNPLVFDHVLFSAAIEDMKSAIPKPENRKISDRYIYQMICRHIYPDDYDQMVDNCIENYKKWKSGKHKPSDINEVRKIEVFLGRKLLRPLFINKPAVEEGTEENMNISQNEIVAAREAYSILSDLIYAQHELMHRYKLSDESHFFSASSNCFPSYFPSFGEVYYKLQKLRFDLPQEVISQAVSLAREIYGFWSSEYEPFLIEKSLDMAAKVDEFEYRAKASETDTDDESTRFFAWLVFANEQAEEYLETLSNIFCDYLR